jgi:sugar phosphate permease
MEILDNNRRDPRRLKLILMNVCVGQFVVGLDQRALLVALPTLTQTFNTSLATIPWVLLIYDLVLIGTVITVGRLGDRFGRRRFYAAGVLIFVLTSTLCGVAQAAWQIILFRGLQGDWRRDGRCALGDLIYLWTGGRRSKPRPDRGTAILGRGARTFRRFIQSHGAHRQYLHAARRVFLRPARRPTRIESQ